MQYASSQPLTLTIVMFSWHRRNPDHHKPQNLTSLRVMLFLKEYLISVHF